MTNDQNILSNWGRWGPDDERGTLNLITPEIVKKAASLIKTGKVYSLGAPLEATGPQWPTRHKTWKVSTFSDTPRGYSTCDDVVIMHSHSGSHIDALSHVWYDGQLYNGFNAAEHIGSQGATRDSIDKGPYIVGRGLLLDIAGWKDVKHLDVGEPVTASDLDDCARAQKVQVLAGDILLVRTGWYQVFFDDPVLCHSGEPGIDATVLPWLKEHDIVCVGSDNHGSEVFDCMPPTAMPVHRAALRDLGVYLIEDLDLELLAKDRVYESFLVIAPLRLIQGVGSPVNPIAIT